MDDQNPSPPTPADDLLKRVLSRLSQAEVARRTGIPQPTLSRWANGGMPDASDDTIKLVALARELAANDGEKARANG